MAISFHWELNAAPPMRAIDFDRAKPTALGPDGLKIRFGWKLKRLNRISFGNFRFSRTSTRPTFSCFDSPTDKRRSVNNNNSSRHFGTFPKWYNSIAPRHASGLDELSILELHRIYDPKLQVSILIVSRKKKHFVGTEAVPRVALSLHSQGV